MGSDERARRSWPFQGLLDDGIVLHPFGRQCLGYKSAGEMDVLDAVDHVLARYNVDPDRIALMGFSMGGAGVWHLGAHYPDRWAVVDISEPPGAERAGRIVRAGFFDEKWQP